MKNKVIKIFLFLISLFVIFAFNIQNITVKVEALVTEKETFANDKNDISGYDNLKQILKEEITPNITNAIIKRFPKTFGYLNNSNIGVGLSFYYGNFTNDTSLGYINFKYAYQNLDNKYKYDLHYSLGINLDRNNLDYQNEDKRNKLESLISHEYMHLFMFETLTSGMTGLIDGTTLPNNKQKFPNWFIEGTAQAVGGGGVDVFNFIGLNKDSSLEEIKAATSHFVLTKDNIYSNYATGYLATMYLGYLIDNNKSITINNISNGLDILLNDIKQGKSLDKAIIDNTKYDGIIGFEANFSNDSALFIKELLTIIDKGYGALISADLKSLDVLPNIKVEEKAFFLYPEDRMIQNIYPNNYQVLSGGLKDIDGVDLNNNVTEYITLNFKIDQHGLFETNQNLFQIKVIKNVSLNDINQVKFLIPNIILDKGYKFDGWSPSFSNNAKFSEDKTFIAKVIIDPNQTFEYKVTYLLKSTNNFVPGIILPNNSSGYLPINKKVEVNSPVVPGYKLINPEDSKVQIVIDSDVENNKKLVFYELDPSQYIDIYFKTGENAKFSDNTNIRSYKIIKNHPLNGINQPTILINDIEVNDGYLVDINNLWSPNFNYTTKLLNNTIYNLNILPDKNKLFKATIYYNVIGEDLPRETKLVYGYNTEEVEIPIIKIKGYKLIDNSPNIIKINNFNNSSITLNYIKDDNCWTSLIFLSGDNAKFSNNETKITYKVIKDLALNHRFQADFTIPRVYPNKGYKLSLNPWPLDFNKDLVINEETIITPNIEIDKSYKEFIGKVNYIYDNNIIESRVLKGYIGQSVIIPNVEFEGYNKNTDNPSSITITEDNNSVVNVYYSKSINKNTNNTLLILLSIFLVVFISVGIGIITRHIIKKKK